MAYTFKPEGSIAQNINRILSEEVKAAFEALTKPGQASGETIHSVRKRIKKIRALFRLVRSEQKEKDFQRLNRYYRDIGHQLSQLRDATVMIKTLDKLREAQSASIPTQVFTRLHKVLVDQQDQATKAFFKDPTKIGQLAKAFTQASQRVEGLGKRHNGFQVVAPNLKEIYRRARKALKVSMHNPSIDHLHELRKEVKTLWYHTRLLQPSWPDLLKAYAHEFGRLGELLGEDHDFGVLAQLIESDQLWLRNQQTKKRVLQGLHEQRTRLQEQIFPLANRLLAEKPGEFVKRIRLPWKLWQQEVSRKRPDQLQPA
ncbi:CHAD domain-containing protein [Spirosoma fluminis]